MNKRYDTLLFAVFISAICTVIAVILFFSFFEIYETTKRAEPSAQAQLNLYHASDLWLIAENHPLRIVERANVHDLTGRNEKTALIFSSSFEWDYYKALYELVKNGVSLAVFIDDMGSENLENFLALCNIQHRIFRPFNSGAAEYEELEADYEAESEESAVFDDDVHFLRDEGKQAPFAYRELGQGRILVTGIPFFMQWENLAPERNPLNAEYAWKFSGALDADKSGIIIARSEAAAKAVEHENAEPRFWEDFLGRKPVLVIALTLLLVVVTGFWLGLSPFGKWKPERSLPGVTIEERLLTEARFFKKYNCLYMYTDGKKQV
ncbi:MAG: hypothetical protein LBC77_08830 [Spirochaetaceae bacterium]|jgi:hypothetical protein|nr:hypothetical protein [Spirochaetaceae bacterium]